MLDYLPLDAFAEKAMASNGNGLLDFYLDNVFFDLSYAGAGTTYAQLLF
ncbi:MAG: hypothetical protein IPL92_12465 [Saprospiraceae bacterium]|nr:hypothetical protein [Candidatus Opimibacter iunctus]